MAINLMAPKGSNESIKLASKIYKKLNEVKAKKVKKG
jgi:hypothetical protein